MDSNIKDWLDEFFYRSEATPYIKEYTNAIIEKNVRIGRNVRIMNMDKVDNCDKKLYSIRSSIVVIPRGSKIPDNTMI